MTRTVFMDDHFADVNKMVRKAAAQDIPDAPYELTFEVPGKPQGKARVRVVRNRYTGKAHGITPENTQSYEDLVRWCWKAAGGRFLGDAQLEVHVAAYFEIPKSYSKKRVREIEEKGLRPTCKPDYDNVMKVISDALNRIAYKDDAQVVMASCEKKYAADGRERVVVTIRTTEGR